MNAFRTTCDPMYGVWHSDDQRWVGFYLKYGDASEIVEAHGDHLVVVPYCELTINVVEQDPAR